MDILARCLKFLTERRYYDERLRNSLNDFLWEVAQSTKVEVWSSVFTTKNVHLLTDILHAKSGKAYYPPHSSVLSDEMVRARLAGYHIVDLDIGITSASGDLPNPHLLIAFCCPGVLSQNEADHLTKALTKICEDSFRASIRRLYESIANAAQHSKDLTSFLHRTIDFILIPEFSFSDISIFYHEGKTKSLILGATTGISRQEELRLKRSDIRYFTDGESYTARAFRDGRELVENVFETRPLKRNTYGEVADQLNSRINMPLRRWEGLRNGDPASNLGVVRALNANSDNNFHPLTNMEVARLRVFCSAASVMTERYMRALSILHDQERATHGYNTDLAAIRYAAQNVEKWLGRIDSTEAYTDDLDLPLREIRYRVRDILAVQDNMASQILTVMYHSGSSRLTSKVSDSVLCEQPYTDVFLRLVSAKKGMSECYGRKELKITFAGSDRAEEKFIRMPPLQISVGHLYLVFRNLAENSIKYSRKGIDPCLDISWSREGSFIEFVFCDNGIGIPKSEHHLVCREGFRGRRAQELQLRGNGLGLSVSQAAIAVWGGSLAFIPNETDGQGSTFSLKVKIR